MPKYFRIYICLITLLPLIIVLGDCREKLKKLPPPAAPKEAYVVTDSFETIYRALTDPSRDGIAKYSSWAAYRGKKIKWAAELFSAQRSGKDVQATFAFLYDQKNEKLIAGVKALFQGEEGEKLLKEAVPGKRVIFEGVLTSYLNADGKAFIINVASAKVVNE